MTLQQALIRARKRLADHPDIDPSLESEVLLRHILKISRARLYLEYGEELSLEKEREFEACLDRRLQGEPLAYIVKHREFFGLNFYVDKRVLIPRPETEHLVEATLEYAQGNPVSVLADIGTGSGAIAISLAKKLTGVKIYATDVSAAALEVAKINCIDHEVLNRVNLLCGDLLQPLPEPVDIIIANLPYVKKDDVPQMPSAKYEPLSALDGGEKGLDWIFRLGRQLKGKLKLRGCLLLEIGSGQCTAVTAFLQELFPSATIAVIPDLAGIERVVRLSFTNT